jgi:hypothetical protein
MSSDCLGFFDPSQPIENAAGNLPHWRQEGVTYFVTFRLADALPAETLALWHREHEDWHRRHPPPHTAAQRHDYHERFIVRFQKWLDAGHGACVLDEPVVRRIVATAIKHFADKSTSGILPLSSPDAARSRGYGGQPARYSLREWVVMPNHVHVVVTPLAGHNLSKILHSWKSFTATAINRQLGHRGALWQKESFDHIVRSADQLERIERYIHDNPRGLAADQYTLGCIHPK